MARLCLLILFILSQTQSHSQNNDQLNDSLVLLPEKFLGEVTNLVDDTERRLTRKTQKYLSRLKKEELRLKRKVSKIDSLTSENIFSTALSSYDDLQNHYEDKTHKIKSTANTYMPFLDSLKTSFQFIEQHKLIADNLKDRSKEITQTLEKITSLDEKFKQSAHIISFIKERKQVLNEKLLSLGLAKELNKFHKEAYYYVKQVQEFKLIINEPNLIIEKSIGIISKVPLFNEFFSKHSELAILFPNISNGGFSNSVNSIQLQGLQTRIQIQNLMQNSFSGSESTQQMIQQGAQAAREQLDLLKSKIDKAGGSNSDFDMPEGFKPNTQRTKTLWKRIEWGINLQSTRSTPYWPITTDFGTSAGFKINDRSIIGIGLAYKMGWGKDINHIVITSQGAGLRSFLDWKVKGKLFITGGAELNYRNEIKSLTIFKDFSSWQQSALIGATLKYSAGKKWKGNFQLLYDALWKKQIPRNQPVLFRTGYNF